MLIEKFMAPSNELSDVGLQSIEMNRLGRYVALTGKNGAGKSRVLTKLEWYIPQFNKDSQHLAQIDANIEAHEQAIRTQPESPSHASWKSNIDGFSRQRALSTDRIFSPTNSSLRVLRFVPKILSLNDPRQQNKATIQAHFNLAGNPGLGQVENYCYAYIQTRQDRRREATHPDSSHTAEIVKEVKEEYESLVSLVELFLKAKIDRSIGSDATLFGKPLADAALSDGQKVLIQLAVALHAQKGKLDNTVFILDEPENHLHPSALIEFLDAVAEVAKNAQFWIATHSVPLLAHIASKEPMSIWYVEDGTVTNSGSKPELVLRGLLGDDEQIANLNAFTSLPAQFSAISFAAECLLPPKTVGGGTGDPQVEQISGLLDFESGSTISLLDYGAGKSRLLSGLVEIASSKGKTLANSLSYFALDSSPDDKAYSLEVINSIYGNATARHFLNDESFFSNKTDASIDVAVMCNVLHEIPPNDWLTLFDKNSLIGRSLKDSGCLLIVEDQRIPTGEKAHKFGFLVLDTSHLRTLFFVTDADIQNKLFQVDDRRDGRLKAHKISKQLLGRLNRDSRKTAIEQLLKTAKDNIRQLRKGEPNSPNGRLHGFWTQQFANASLALDEI